MAIQNARSNTSGSYPASLADGQIALQQVDGVLMSRRPDGSVRRTLLPKRYGLADAAFQVRAFDTYIGIVSITAARTIYLPPAASYQPGHQLVIADESGAVSPTLAVTIAPAPVAVGATPDTINGVRSLTLPSPYFGVKLFSDGISKWVATGLPASGAANALLVVAQAITAGQQDQARLNLSGAVAANPSATTPLVALDYERDQYATGTTTLTMPATVAPGWRTGVVTNDNPLVGLVVLAVPAGQYLDGTINGTATLYPRQRARLRMVSAGAWRTDWIDRSPILFVIPPGAGVPNWDFQLPVGYKTFFLVGNGIVPNTSNSVLFGRLSDDGGATIKTGSTDYNLTSIYSDGGTGPSGSNLAAPQWQLSGGIYTAAAGNSLQTEIRLDPGGGGQRPTFMSRVGFPEATTANQGTRVYSGVCSAISTNRANVFRLLLSAGTAVGGWTLRGEP